MGAFLSTLNWIPQYGNRSRTTKITDLPNECLIKIFEHLDTQDLFNEAIANKRFRPIAAEVHKRQPREIRILLKYHTGGIRLFDMQTQQNGAAEYFKVRGSKKCLKYIRFFGASISNLVIDYEYIGNSCFIHKHVYQHINTYCVDIEIKFLRLSKASIKQFPKPFINVRCVTVEDSNLGEYLPEFAKCFPNLRHLRLKDLRSTAGFDRVHFPHLEQLSLSGSLDKSYKDFSKNLLGANRQLRSLDIQLRDISMNALLDMIKDHSLITKLTVSKYIFSTGVNSDQMQRIAKEHPSLIELDLKDFLRFTADGVIALIDQLKSLKTFSFQILETSENIRRLESTLNRNEWAHTKIERDISYWKLDRKN